MARTKATLSGTARLADFLTVGYLALQCPVRQVRATLERHGCCRRPKIDQLNEQVPIQN
jgi:hypothetical protein